MPRAEARLSQQRLVAAFNVCVWRTNTVGKCPARPRLARCWHDPSRNRRRDDYRQARIGRSKGVSTAAALRMRWPYGLRRTSLKDSAHFPPQRRSALGSRTARACRVRQACAGRE
eukprot:5587679-Pyramimonas_sp.AAC.1